VSLALSTNGMLSRNASLSLSTGGVESPVKRYTAELTETLVMAEGVESAYAPAEKERTQLFGVMTPTTKIKGTLSR
jgi:hypothetical protein